MSYFYKTDSPKVLAAVRAWDHKKAAWNAQRKKLGQAFGGAASPMFSGTRSYVGGIKLSAHTSLDVHWCRPDQYGYRALRASPKHAKGIDKETRANEKAEHQRLRDLWAEHCPPSIDQDEMWTAIGVNTGGVWLAGGVCFEHEGKAFMNLGCQADSKEVDGLVEIVSSEYEAVRQRVLNQRKAA
ncbi:hypothetical protein N5F23_00550 [Pseudomonas sichuanensis]|uniref:hypothetical protein n=1 Tax=Pseudomonas sichuanensis TaxID=2213015 RepID=UPI00244687B0|nr:hypothetical protein [Pseudomonas sichuanensis]MDH0730941.1 hypothetical protein [Pseudomonas sichuanensis]MDH1581082.1 hypothetical protein [Pseudomonas sichuanensis]MDH1591057.1 hypothetical protein [Pseudomonas sichuanensis]MDH1596726.1 hypothetical protein [Pseudomonas sichuanensis]